MHEHLQDEADAGGYYVARCACGWSSDEAYRGDGRELWSAGVWADHVGDAVEVLTTRRAFDWPSRFFVRNRFYVLVPGGPASFYEDRGVFRVWPAGGGVERDLTVRRSDAVRVVSYSSS